MTVTFEALYPTVAPYVSGCPEPTVDALLHEAAQQFARDTRLWEAKLGSTTLPAPADVEDPISFLIPSAAEDSDGNAVAVADRDFNLPAESQIIALSRYRFTQTGGSVFDTEKGDVPGEDDVFLANGTQFDLETNLFAIWRDENFENNQQHFSVGGELEVWASLEPTTNAVHLVTTLERYATAIKDWALHELMRMPKTSWYDFNGSSRSRTAYNLKVAEATRIKAKGRARQPLRVERHRMI